MSYAELAAISAFSFLEGASLPEELVAQAASLGYSALGIADHNSLAGVVRAHVAAKAAGLRLLVGARLGFADAPEVICYPTDRAAWGRLCRLLSLGKTRAAKGACDLRIADLADQAAGQILIIMPPARVDEAFSDFLDQAQHWRCDRLYLAAARRFAPDDAHRLAALERLGGQYRLKLIAVNDVLYHEPERRMLQDVLRCIRMGSTLEQAGTALEPHGERYLKPPAEMARLLAAHPDALCHQDEILRRVTFSLDELRYEYPHEPVPEGTTPDEHLAALTWQGAMRRYPKAIPAAVRATIERELALIAELEYARYFLTVNDIVCHARHLGILCQGRGSAANSAVCYALGITAVDPAEIDLLFARFISAERREPPDIDVDFEHERREEIIQYLYQRYGRTRAALAATVIHFRPRSAIRAVGSVLGLAQDATAALAAQSRNPGDALWSDAQLREAGLDPSAPVIRRVVDLARLLIGLPRHLSQHVGGFVLTSGRLDETVPIGPAAMAGRSFIEWDKDDINALGMMKVDILALGMLTAIRKCFALIGIDDLASVPREDKHVYAMLTRGDSIGVFQVESRAQMNMLPRLAPRCFYDLVIEVAIVRPGPIQGDMVHPYLRRRQGHEPIEFPAPDPAHGPPDELRRVLGRTLGVPLFQEQAMRIAIEAAQFTPDEANALRRAMATFRNIGTIQHFRTKLVGGMVQRGYPADFAEACFRQIEGFGTYGFPESHAASFAHLVYVSAWLKCHHPAAFTAALLNAQPMGFYAPAQLISDARSHGVHIHPIDVTRSDWDCTVVNGALQLGLRLVAGFREAWAVRIMQARRAHDLAGLAALALPRSALMLLAEADALRGIGLDRRRALWQIGQLDMAPSLPLFGPIEPSAKSPALPVMRTGEQVLSDYQTTGFSLRAHPLALLRGASALAGTRPCASLATVRDGSRISLAGLVTVRQRPGSAKGTMFITIEDETGIANLILWPANVAAFHAVIIAATLLRATGQVQRSAERVVHVIIEDLQDCSALISTLDVPMARADEGPTPHRSSPRHPSPHHPSPHHPSPRHPRNERPLTRSRDFR